MARSPSDDVRERGLRAAFAAELRESTLRTGRVVCAIALTLYPAWSAFDFLVAPSTAAGFMMLRLLGLVPIGVATAFLWTRRGRRRPEIPVFTVLATIEVTISEMVARVPDAKGAYAVGLTLAIYATACLVMWPWRYTAALIAITVAALTAAIAVAPTPLTAAELGTVAFYVGTAALLAMLGQIYRHRLTWREFVGRAALQREQERNAALVARLERLSREDPLTGLANRRSFDEALARELSEVRRHGGDVAVILCDVDHFKRVNDEQGHAAGDHVLRTLAAGMGDTARAEDLVARIGGDELAVLCPQSDLDEAVEVALRLADATARSGTGATLSVGVGAATGGDLTPATLLARADADLYRAKETRDSVWAGGRRREPVTA